MLLVPVAVAVLVATAEIVQILNGPSIDIAFSGVMTGRMTELSSWQGHPTSCSVGKVYGTSQWDGQLIGTLNGKQVEINVALTPYHGAAIYSDAGIPDAQTLARLTPAEFYQMKLPVHILMSVTPSGASTVTLYGTEPDPAARPTSMEELGRLAGLGEASVTLNPDQKSGRVQATLMNAKAPTSPPVRLDGSFKCAAVGKSPDS